MKFLYYILLTTISPLFSPLMAQCDGNACYITLDNPSRTKEVVPSFIPSEKGTFHTSSTYLDIISKENFLSNHIDYSNVNPFYSRHNLNEYCQFEETLVFLTEDTFECVEDISSWIKV